MSAPSINLQDFNDQAQQFLRVRIHTHRGAILSNTVQQNLKCGFQQNSLPRRQRVQPTSYSGYETVACR